MHTGFVIGKGGDTIKTLESNESRAHIQGYDAMIRFLNVLLFHCLDVNGEAFSFSVGNPA